KYRQDNKTEDICTAIQKFQESLDLTPEDHPDKAKRLHDLASCFATRYRHCGDQADLDHALNKLQQALDLTPEGHPDHPFRLNNLAFTFADRYLQTGNLADIDNALLNHEKAVNHTPDADPTKAERLKHFAVAFLDRYKKSGDLLDLDAASDKFQQLLKLTPEEDSDRASRLEYLGLCSSSRFHASGNIADLDSAVKTFQEVLNLTPNHHPQRPSRLHNLASSLSHLYEKARDPVALEAALRYYQEALDLTPNGHPDESTRLHYLAVTFKTRYQESQHLGDLDTALGRFRQVFELTPDGHPSKPLRLQNVADTLQNRYHKSGDLMDLENAIQTHQAVLDLTPEEHHDRPGHLTSLSLCLIYRYRRLGDLTDLDAALKNFQTTVILTPDGHPDKPGHLMNFGTSLITRYKRLGDMADLENGIQNLETALTLIPNGSQMLLSDFPDKGICFENIAACYKDRYEMLKTLEELDAALRNNQEAVDLTPEGHHRRSVRTQNLASCFADRYLLLKDQTDLLTARTHYVNSFRMISATPDRSWAAALQWAFLAARFLPSECLNAYKAAFNLLPELIWLGSSIGLRQNVIRRLDLGHVTASATLSSIALGNLTAAVEFLEQGVATIFQQLLQLKPNFDQLPPDLAKDLEALSSQLYSRDCVDLTGMAIQRKLLVDRIRKEPNLEYFLLPKPYSALCKASHAGPIVILNSQPVHCDAIVILNSTSSPVHLPLDVKLDVLESQRAALKKVLDRCNLSQPYESGPSRLVGHREFLPYKTTQECFEELLGWLWIHVVRPVYRFLERHDIDKGRLWWLPTGEFSGLPLHASCPDDKFIHSYTATLGSLLEGYAQKPTTQHNFGIIGVTHTGSEATAAHHLQGVQQEVANIQSIIPKSNTESLIGEQATVNAVRDQLQDCAWVHLACHGTQDLVNPAKSCLLLYDGNLELESILQMQLPEAEVVFLAACQTAMGDAELINESFHLGGGFIAAGFRGAVGTLWSINDMDGPPVAESFYSYLFRDKRRPVASDAAEALHLAVKKLRAMNVPYERWIPFIHMGI
ncbi:CHAT domain-containing protein, partial [Mycena crocata]